MIGFHCYNFVVLLLPVLISSVKLCIGYSWKNRLSFINLHSMGISACKTPITKNLLLSTPGPIHRSIVHSGAHDVISLILFSKRESGSDIHNSQNDLILRKVDKWACVKNCGACCKLGPLSSRPELSSYLSEAEYQQYTSMIGHDDWCVNFDQNSRMCTVYDTRPDFCCVEPKAFKRMYGVNEDELNVSKL